MTNRSANISMGSAFGHAGEFLQGIVDDGGELKRVLVSIPAPGLRSRVIFMPSGGNELTVFPEWKQKSLRAFQLAWLQFSSTNPCGTLVIRSDIPVSRGLGSSTADCVAAIRAAGSHWNCKLRADQIAVLAHQAECFSDATMFENRLVVFQHCEGRVHEYLDGAIPNLRLLIVEPSDGGYKVDTDTLVRPDYTKDEIREFTECLTRFRRAAAANDTHEIADIARISARINQAYHPKQKRDEVERIAADTDALGVAIAHSGDMQILLYLPGSLSEQKLRRVSDELDRVGMRCWQTLSTISEPQTANIPSCV
jgi:uncharacterized protein involved in propanediol utilization